MTTETIWNNRLNGKQAILIYGDFHNFEIKNLDALDQVLQEHPNLADCLPSENSIRTAFTTLKNKVEKKKTSLGKIVCIRAKKDDIATWTWTGGQAVLDGFSIHIALPDSQLGHKSESEGVIGLAENGSLIVSVTAEVFFGANNIDPQAEFEKAKNDMIGEFRRKFDKFINQHLGVKAWRLAGSSYFVKLEMQSVVDDYIKAIRKLGVTSNFIDSLYIDVHANQKSFTDSLVQRGKAFVKDLEERIKNTTKARQATLDGDSKDLVDMLDILNEFGVSDDLINEINKVKSAVDEQLDAIKKKNETKTPRQYLPIKEKIAKTIPSKLLLRSKLGRPQELLTKEFEYDHEYKTIYYIDENGNKGERDAYRMAGITVRCIVSEGSTAVLEEIDINVEKETYCSRKSQRTDITPAAQASNAKVKKDKAAPKTVDPVIEAEEFDDDPFVDDQADDEPVSNESSVVKSIADEQAEEPAAEESIADEQADEPIADEPAAGEADATLLEYLAAKEALGYTPTKEELVNKYSLAEVSELLRNGAIYEYKGFIYADDE